MTERLQPFLLSIPEGDSHRPDTHSSYTPFAFLSIDPALDIEPFRVWPPRRTATGEGLLVLTGLPPYPYCVIPPSSSAASLSPKPNTASSRRLRISSVCDINAVIPPGLGLADCLGVKSGPPPNPKLAANILGAVSVAVVVAGERGAFASFK